MEPHGVTFTGASGLKPNTTVYAFFDGVNVDVDCSSTAGVSGPLLQIITEILQTYFPCSERNL